MLTIECPNCSGERQGPGVRPKIFMECIGQTLATLAKDELVIDYRCNRCHTLLALRLPATLVVPKPIVTASQPESRPKPEKRAARLPR